MIKFWNKNVFRDFWRGRREMIKNVSMRTFFESREAIDRGYRGDTRPPKSCKVMQATWISPSAPAGLGTRLSLSPRHFLRSHLPVALEIIFVWSAFFHREIVTQHAYTVVCFFGNSPRNRRSFTSMLEASPKVRQLFRRLLSTTQSSRL